MTALYTVPVCNSTQATFSGHKYAFSHSFID